MQKQVGTEELTPVARPGVLVLSDGLRRTVDLVGRWGSWLIVPLVLVTCLDVVARKLIWRAADGSVQGLQVWLVRYVSKYFDSALMQELEWHFHTALFALVLGFGTIYNTHVRVDLVRDHVSFRNKVRLEFAGLTFFMLPFLLLTIWFSSAYVMDSYAVSERSASAVGLTHRWIIKSIFVGGLVVATLAGIAVWLQTAYLIWGRQDHRFPLMTLEWPEEAGTRIEGKERIKLEDAPAEPAVPPTLAGAPPGLKPAE
jgi:TRAP-type mannitol/chloroaromatic compound transport system permease small subunit